MQWLVVYKLDWQFIPLQPRLQAQMPLLLLLAAALSLIFYYIITTTTTTARSRARNFPPSPWKLPIIGNLHQMTSLPHRSLASLSEKHGPVMLLHLGRVPHLVVSSSSAARAVLNTQDRIFSSRPALKIPHMLLYGCTDIAMSPRGAYWRKVRKLTTLHLLSPQKVQSYRSVREEEVALMMEKISRSCSAAVNVSEVLAGLSKDVLSRAALGRSARGEEWEGRVSGVLEECNTLMNEFHFGDYWPWLSWVSRVVGLEARARRTVEELDGILQGVVDNRGKVGGRGCLVDELLAAVGKGEGDDGVAISLDGVKGIMGGLFGAGIDATSITLEWAMAELLKNPEAMRILQDEVRGTVKSPKTLLEENDLTETKYLRAVIAETLRLHPPSPLLLPHQLTENTHLEGYEIPKGARVLVNAWAIARDVTYWEAPNDFRPERFLSSSILDHFQGHNLQFIPFGAGRRACQGKKFALSIIELALANLVYSFDWELPLGMTREDMDMEEVPRFVSKKKVPLLIVAKPYSR